MEERQISSGPSFSSVNLSSFIAGRRDGDDGCKVYDGTVTCLFPDSTKLINASKEARVV